MNPVSEATVESAVLDWLGSAGWRAVHGPDIAPDTPGAERGDYGEVLLAGRLRTALGRLNPEPPDDALEDTLRRLKRPAGATLEARNRDFHRMLVDGVTVEYATPDGAVRGAQVRVIDFDVPEANDWLAVNQFTVVENKHERRPDIVLLVNMERRGDGVPAILRETRELSGRLPEYRLVDDAEVLLMIPAAPQDAMSSRAVVTVRAEGQLLPGADVLVLFPNRTWKHAVTDENGEAAVDLYTTELPMTVFGAATGYAACLKREWLPADGALAIELSPLPRGGSVIFPEATGHLPGLGGRLNPLRDTLDRTYLYASNIAIGQGRQQPVHFVPGEELRLTDADGTTFLVRIVEIVGRSALLEYRVPEL